MNKKFLLIFFCITTILILTTTAAADNTTTTQETSTIHDTIDKTSQLTQENTNTHTLNNEKTNTKYTNKTTKKSINTNTLTQQLIDKQDDNTTITLQKGNYKLDPLQINKNLTIIGENKTQTILTTNSTKSLFNIVNQNTHLNLINITIQDHTSNETPTINNNGILTVDNVIIKNNTCKLRTAKGGAIYNTGNLTVINSEFQENTASWGASIYNFQANTTIENSQFTGDHTYNVGGALYTIRGNMTINNSRIVQNRGVSGAGIYNAFGKLNVNNTLFLKNDAESFYGGAIYSTGIANVENSNFLFNHAQYMGGAITNTNNFTVTNCSFESNTAGESGGAIENIAWSNTENGNLTIIMCNFTENSATTANGGAIINLNSTEVLGNYGTITARKCIFDSNTASKKGGAIYNDQYINVEYNIFRNNEADTNNDIYTQDVMIKSIENNWWSQNNPNWKKVGVTPNKWVVMTFTNQTLLLENMQTKTIVTLDSLNDNTKLYDELPLVEVIYISSNATFKENFQTLNKTSINTCIPTNETITAKIDNQRLNLTPTNANITYTLIDNNTKILITYNLPSIINAKTSVKINGKTIFNKQLIKDGKLNLTYTIPVSYANDEYTLTYVINNHGNILNKNDILIIPKRNITMIISTNQTKIQTGDMIQIKADLKLAGIKITTGRVSFKINGKTIQSNVNVINGTATINYLIPDSFRASSKYNITAVYSGDFNKNRCDATQNLKITKQDIHIEDMTPFELMAGSSIRVPIELLDTHNNSIQPSKLCYKINGKTYKTNITTEDGVFYFDYITPTLKTGSSLKQTLTIKVGENRIYNEAIFNITLKIE